ncbi:hypothetical protein BCL32_3148 [Rhizobium mongolense USDA 1844]|uniref:Uncharacterized protein n=1 Tax=Rhizobium mongolense USDA 1844 TaxID=1079460 RepID=A0A559SL00_9HYPH|nr:hypothetical protein BCL32_3148 [Rhizobium mongolense USDA 1844]
MKASISSVLLLSGIVAATSSGSIMMYWPFSIPNPLVCFSFGTGSSVAIDEDTVDAIARGLVDGVEGDAASCLRLVRALAVETHEKWLEANRYINMEDLKEHKKIMLKAAA